VLVGLLYYFANLVWSSGSRFRFRQFDLALNTGRLSRVEQPLRLMFMAKHVNFVERIITGWAIYTRTKITIYMTIFTSCRIGLGGDL
jgi:hypothetical protein